MIGFISGVLVEKDPPQLIVDVNGIGYEVDAPMSTFQQLCALGETIRLFTHFVVREDAQQLYGFYSKDERLLFRTLLKVNGVGPRLALTILSSVDPGDFVRAVLNNDTQSLIRMPGVGKKTAERLVIEMRDKLGDWQQALPQFATHSSATAVGGHASTPQRLQDAIAALVALGYKPQEANRLINKVDDGNLTSELLIRQALREMM